MIIDDDSGEETIYQTEKEGGEDLPDQAQAQRRDPPTPSNAPTLKKPPKCNPHGCTGRVKHGTPKGDEHDLGYPPHNKYTVRIFDPQAIKRDPDADPLDQVSEVPGGTRVRIVGNGGRRIRT